MRRSAGRKDGNPNHSSTDFTVQNEFTIFLLRPLIDGAREWLSEHTPDDVQWFGDAIVVEHQYIADIDGIPADGLEVR
jgi:hypothetical protein